MGARVAVVCVGRLTRTPRGLRTVRTGYTHARLLRAVRGYVYRRRRAACPGHHDTPCTVPQPRTADRGRTVAPQALTDGEWSGKAVIQCDLGCDSVCQVVVVHTRHPIEALVSHYYCVSDARVCPRRAAFYQNSSASSSAIASRAAARPTALLALAAGGAVQPPRLSIGEYFASELPYSRGGSAEPAPHSTLSQLLERHEQQCRLLTEAEALLCAGPRCAALRGALRLVRSRYEELVSCPTHLTQAVLHTYSASSMNHTLMGSRDPSLAS